MNSSSLLHAQVGNFESAKNSVFPNEWDENRDLRGKNAKVLMWKHVKRGTSYEARYCITLLGGSDSLGNVEYFISEQYSNTTPFIKWHYGFIHYSDYFIDSATGISFGYRDLHLQKYDHRPSEDELYKLFQKWRYATPKPNTEIIEAGIDEKLWLNTFGFAVDRQKLSKIE